MLRLLTKRNRGRNVRILMQEGKVFVRGWIGYFRIVNSQSKCHLSQGVAFTMGNGCIKFGKSVKSIENRGIKRHKYNKKAWQTSLSVRFLRLNAVVVAFTMNGL